MRFLLPILMSAFGVVSIAAISACGSAQQPLGVPVTLTQGAAGALRPDRRPSWMSKEAATNNLLYVTDNSTGDVFVYAYPKGTLVGTLTGFSDPLGDCVDSTGNVWIVNAGTAQVIEYAHGGTTPISTLSGSGFIQFCAVSKKTGDLAATRSDLPNSSVTIWPGAQGAPQSFVPSNIYQVYFCGYDSKGNLYVDGIASPSGITPAYAELPKGGTAFNNITLSPNPGYPGGLQFCKRIFERGRLCDCGESSRRSDLSVQLEWKCWDRNRVDTSCQLRNKPRQLLHSGEQGRLVQ